MLRHYTGQTLAEVEREYILATLARCGGNRSAAARILDISIRGLRGKLKRYAREGRALPGTRDQYAPHRADAAIENESGLLWG